MAEDAGAADLIAGGACSWESAVDLHEQVIDGWRYLVTAQMKARMMQTLAGGTPKNSSSCLRGKGFARA